MECPDDDDREEHLEEDAKNRRSGKNQGHYTEERAEATQRDRGPNLLHCKHGPLILGKRWALHGEVVRDVSGIIHHESNRHDEVD